MKTDTKGLAPSPCARCGAIILIDDWQADERRQAQSRLDDLYERDRDRMQALEEDLELMRHKLESLEEQRDQAREDLARANSETRKAYEQLRAVEKACAEELKKHRAS